MITKGNIQQLLNATLNVTYKFTNLCINRLIFKPVIYETVVLHWLEKSIRFFNKKSNYYYWN